MWMWRYGGGVNSINIIEWCLGDGGCIFLCGGGGFIIEYLVNGVAW